MLTHLEHFLAELYAVDPDLRSHELELIPILEKMLAVKPNVEPDPAFVEHLRMQLREKTQDTRHKKQHFSFLPLLPMHHLQYTLAGLLVGVILTGPVVYSLTQNGGIPTSTSTQNLFYYSVEETGSEAFGDLSTIQTEAYGRGGGGGAPESDASMTTRPQSGGGGGDAKMMIAPEMTEYNLVYEGEIPALTASVDVFKRLKGGASADISKILGSFDTGLIDLGTFPGAKTDMMSFYQDTQYGYMVNIAFRDGSIGISQNWEKWPHPESLCQDEVCYQRYRTGINDIPADDAVIAIANDFVQDHGIDLAAYGSPEVDNLWRVQYEAATDKSMVYIPDTVRVVYPQLIEGAPVHEQGGMKAGLSISVNVRENKVSDAYGIMDQKYQKSGYAGVTDEAAIRAYLANYGNMGNWMPEGTTIKTTDIMLGAPTLGYVKTYSYANGMSEELIVPALIFPVENMPADAYFYSSSITVPLAKDLFDQMNQPQPTPYPMPVDIPLIMEEGDEGATR